MKMFTSVNSQLFTQFQKPLYDKSKFMMSVKHVFLREKKKEKIVL